MPPAVWFTTLVLAGAVTFAGLRKSPLRKSIAVVLIGLAIAFVPLYVLVNERIMVGVDVQPRYIYPLVVLLTGVSLYGLRRLNLGLSRLQLVIVVLGLAIANAVALHTNLRRYVTGINVQGLNLDRKIEWWWNLPIGPFPLWVIGVFAFAVALICAAMLDWPHSRTRPALRATTARS
jgi:hypothetical protein